MVNACQAMSYTPLHSLQATKFTNLEDTNRKYSRKNTKRSIEYYQLMRKNETKHAKQKTGETRNRRHRGHN